MPKLKIIHGEDGEHKYHDSLAKYEVINYCLSPYKTPNGFIGGYGVNIKQAAFEMELIAHAYGKAGGLQLRHFVLAFSQEETRRFQKRVYENLYKIGGFIAGYYSEQYQIIFAVHEDKDHPHIHFVMNSVNYRTGAKYRGDKADYYSFQAYVAKFLLEQYGLYLTTA